MKQKEVFIIGVLTALLLAGCGSTSSVASSSNPSSSIADSDKSALSEKDTSSEIENYTRYTDYTPVKAKDAGITSGSAGNILVAYFSRSSNTSLSGIDAVSSASLQI